MSDKDELFKAAKSLQQLKAEASKRLDDATEKVKAARKALEGQPHRTQ